ncbi:MAG TPA: ABC transporter substrate-binding protein [Armatimonadota bacterium]|jgi:simple sugar transport system substrate-binding protein
MTKRERCGVFAAIAVAACVAAGCGGKSNPGTAVSKGKMTTVGFAQIGAESGWRTAETQSIQDEAKKRGVSLQFSDAQQKQENQIKAVRTFIAQKVDAIILAPVVETGWEPVLKEARTAGIPVFLADRAVNVQDPGLYVTLVSPDVVEEGRMAGRWMAKALNGKGNIVELKGTVGSSPANDREKGFHEILTKYPGMKIVISQSGDFTRAKGKEAMEAFLKSPVGKHIDALYAHNDDMALGAVQAIEQAGLKPGVDIKIVSIDAVHDAFVAMAAGKLNCTVECNPLLGPAIFDAIEAHLAGKPLAKKISLKERTYEASEAASVLPTRKY